jgi:hypothetical protein
MIFRQRRYKKHFNIVSRRIADQVILVPVKKNISDLDSIYTLNQVAARIWELIDGERTFLEIKNAVVDEFAVNPDEAKRDLTDFLETLEKIAAVTEV